MEGLLHCHIFHLIMRRTGRPHSRTPDFFRLLPKMSAQRPASARRQKAGSPAAVPDGAALLLSYINAQKTGPASSVSSEPSRSAQTETAGPASFSFRIPSLSALPRRNQTPAFSRIAAIFFSPSANCDRYAFFTPSLRFAAPDFARFLSAAKPPAKPRPKPRTPERTPPTKR